MKIIDNRETFNEKVEVGDILETTVGLRMVVKSAETDLYHTVSLENGCVQLNGIESIEKIVEFYAGKIGDRVRVIKKNNIELTLKGRKGE